MDFNDQGIFKSFQYEKHMSRRFEDIIFNLKFSSADDDDQMIKFQDAVISHLHNAM